MSRVYIDTEFEGLWKTANLISLGLVSDDGKELYIEFNDIDVDKQSDWIKQNVLANTVYYGNIDLMAITKTSNYFVGDKYEVKNKLIEWFKQFPEVQIVSDVCHYDFVQFIDIFGTAFDLPANINASCHDINQDIARFYYIPEKVAFDMSREDILENFGVYIDGWKHNALYDAKVIREIYRGIANSGII